jgi:uncharacterized protein (DUF2062 family)
MLNKALFGEKKTQGNDCNIHREDLAGTPKTTAGKLRRAYERFIKIRGTPRQIALGLAVGLFIGFCPIVFQMPLAVVIAALFRWNKLSAAAGVMITNPATAPIIYSLTYLVGAKLMGFQMAFKLSMLSDLSAFIEMVRQTPRIFISLMIGGIVVGAPTAVIGYFLAYKAVDKYQKDLKDKIVRQKERLKKKVKRKKKAGRPSKKRHKKR